MAEAGYSSLLLLSKWRMKRKKPTALFKRQGKLLSYCANEVKHQKTKTKQEENHMFSLCIIAKPTQLNLIANTAIQDHFVYDPSNQTVLHLLSPWNQLISTEPQPPPIKNPSPMLFNPVNPLRSTDPNPLHLDMNSSPTL